MCGPLCPFAGCTGCQFQGSNPVAAVRNQLELWDNGSGPEVRQHPEANDHNRSKEM